MRNEPIQANVLHKSCYNRGTGCPLRVASAHKHHSYIIISSLIRFFQCSMYTATADERPVIQKNMTKNLHREVIPTHRLKVATQETANSMNSISVVIDIDDDIPKKTEERQGTLFLSLTLYVPVVISVKILFVISTHSQSE